MRRNELWQNEAEEREKQVVRRIEGVENIKGHGRSQYWHFGK